MIYDVFISYRRDGGFETAKHLNDLLVRDGYSVSFDIDTLREGNFDNTLLERIEQCSDFLLIVNKDAFARMLDLDSHPEEDWLRRELAYALQLRKNIIPVLLAGASFPNLLPDDVKEVRSKNGPKYSKDYFDTFYAKLKGFMHALPRCAPASNLGVESPATANLKVKCDLDCVFYLDGEERLQLKADQLQKIPLFPGEYELVFVGAENPADRLVQDFRMPQEDKLLKVSLKEIRDKRLEKEAEEERRLATSDREFTVNGVSFKMIYVEGGTFQMGSDDVDVPDDMKPISVTLSSYHIGETPVTQALWKAVMGTTIRQQRDLFNPEWPALGEGDDYPIHYVSWEECQEFIQKLNQLTGKTFRLPTEAEWEYAARGGKHHSPYKYAGSDNIDDVAWYIGNSGDNYLTDTDDMLKIFDTTNYIIKVIKDNHCKTHPVKTKKPNALGIYDMSGNASEWCQDWFYSGLALIGPEGPSESWCRVRVLRGGSLGTVAMSCRVYNRYCDDPSSRYYDNGFRLAL